MHTSSDRLLPLPVTVIAPDIPRRLHQVWVGSPPPGWVRTLWRNWDRHLPDWEILRWTEDTLTGPMRRTADLASRRGLSPRALADLIRVQAVSLYGGVYADCDTVPLGSLEPFVGRVRPWVGSAPRTRTTATLANATFGFPAHHPFLAEVWAQAQNALSRGLHADHFIAGPRVFRRVYDLDPASVEVYWTFANEWPTDLVHAVRTCADLDLEDLRRRYPSVPVLHVECNYGTWKGRFA